MDCSDVCTLIVVISSKQVLFLISFELSHKCRLHWFIFSVSFFVFSSYEYYSRCVIRWIHERDYQPRTPEGTNHAAGIEAVQRMLSQSL